MKRIITYPQILLGGSILLVLACGPRVREQEAEVEAPPAVERFEIQRGVNISHWLSQSQKRGKERLEFITKKDIDYIASIGYDHIRIPIDEEQMWDEEGTKESEAFELLHNGIGWAQENNLKVVVDLHILRSHHFIAEERPLWTEKEAQQAFFKNWEDLSQELIKYPNDLVAYELMNEPVADDPEDWNVLVEKAVDVIRKNEPHRFIVIGSNLWQSHKTFNELRVPKGDKFIILSFHFYHPFMLTHYRTSWNDIYEYDGPVRYPGLSVELSDIAAIEDEDLRNAVIDHNGEYYWTDLEAMMIKPITKAQETGLQLYCGEFGCYPTVPRKSLINWYKDMRMVLEKNNIAWANWDYKGGFGVVKDGKPVEDITSALLDRK